MDKIAWTGTRKGASLYTSSAQLRHTSNIMERDKYQSHRLHEPTSIHSHTDPITGKDVMERVGGPFIIDGILTAYFETDETRSFVQVSYQHYIPMVPTRISTLHNYLTLHW